MNTKDMDMDVLDTIVKNIEARPVKYTPVQLVFWLNESTNTIESDAVLTVLIAEYGKTQCEQRKLELAIRYSDLFVRTDHGNMVTLFRRYLLADPDLIDNIKLQMGG